MFTLHVELIHKNVNQPLDKLRFLFVLTFNTSDHDHIRERNKVLRGFKYVSAEQEIGCFLCLLYFNIVHICTLRGNSNIFNSSSSLLVVPSRSCVHHVCIGKGYKQLFEEFHSFFISLYFALLKALILVVDV